MQLTCLVLGLALAAGASWGAEYYVGPDGSDANPGTEQRPFRTIQRGADAMKAGDTCYVREGTYRETVSVRTSGEAGKPIRFAAYPGELVTLSGTEPIEANWVLHEGSIYKARVDSDFEQLFVDGEMMIEARWPNMRFEERFDRSKWAKAGVGSRYGKMVDPELAKTGIDWTGALATLNVAHQFYTWTRPQVVMLKRQSGVGRSLRVRFAIPAMAFDEVVDLLHVDPLWGLELPFRTVP
jgi:hypothetical protein